MCKKEKKMELFILVFFFFLLGFNVVDEKWELKGVKVRVGGIVVVKQNLEGIKC